MKLEKRNGDQERKILIGMVMSKTVLGRIAAKWEDGGLFRSRWSNLIGGWCVKHYRRYGIAPGRDIETRFELWANASKDHETIESVGRFLNVLSDEYSNDVETNAEFIIDMAGTYFNSQRLLTFSEELQDHVGNLNIEAAELCVATYRKVELGASTGIDVLNDREAWIAAFEQQSNPLITLPGAIGEFIGSEIARDTFVSFMGPEKRGKSFWLMDFAWRGILARRNVAYFQVGDQSQNQVLLRLASRISRRPIKYSSYDWPRNIERPDDKSDAKVESEHRKVKPLSWQAAWKAVQSEKKLRIRSKRPLFRLHCSPAGTLSVDQMKEILATWEQQHDWRPDLIVIDYADILALPIGMDRREGTNHVWQSLRGLSEAQHCCVLTASQANTASYRTATITRENFTEDKRKLAHVTGMIGLNQTPEEKAAGILRLNWVVVRERENNERQCCYVAECRSVARPFVVSCW